MICVLVSTQYAHVRNHMHTHHTHRTHTNTLTHARTHAHINTLMLACTYTRNTYTHASHADATQTFAFSTPRTQPTQQAHVPPRTLCAASCAHHCAVSVSMASARKALLPSLRPCLVAPRCRRLSAWRTCMIVCVCVLVCIDVCKYACVHRCLSVCVY